MLRNAIRNKTLRSGKIKGRVVAGWTTKYIFIVYLIILFGSLIEYFILKREINIIISISGVLLYAIGIMGRQWAFNSLGKYWSVDIEIRENHEIIRKGPYRHMRHPNNAFHLLEVIGITLVPNSYYSLLILLFAYLPIIILRSIIEEKAMFIALNENYAKYKQETI
ncbi:MAG: isoprenylcysteine carboxylmethyltransferase family protein [Elusimicrobiota bacterium]